MKKAIAVTIGLMLSAQTAMAGVLPDQINTLQGNTLELRVPKFDRTHVSGTFKGTLVPFYEITLEPKFDEAISRAEFLRLLFSNHDFGELDTEGIEDFPDVPPGHPYYEEVMLAKQNSVVNGYENGDFGPYDPLTRGQIAKILVEVFEPVEVISWTETVENDGQEVTYEYVGPIVFEDVPEDHAFYGYLGSAVRANYFQGYPDGLMRPDRNINFSEAEVVIQRATGLDEIETLGPRDYFRAFLGTHRIKDSGDKNFELRLTTEEGDHFESTNISIGERSYPVISFSMDKEDTDLFGKEEQDTTWAQINGAKANPIAEQLWEGPFIIPTIGEITLGFGDKLYINGAYAGSHFGYDYANRSKPPIWASNTGKVTLAEWTPSYGYTVVIDHGQNVFTMYLHLETINVEEGDFVDIGDVLGKMGTTGISTGIHLHFTHFVGDIIVDSQEWYDGKFLQ